MTHTIALDALTLDADLQPRDQIDTKVLEEYAHLLAEGISFPPVIVFFDGATRWLADGYHRWHAHKAIHLSEIAADVRLGSKKDALLYSLSANAEHGKQRSYADYSKAYKIIKKNELCEPWNTGAVHRLIQCSQRWAEKLTKRARDKRDQEREVEIQAAKADGKSNRQIAEEIDASPSKVDRIVRASKANSSDLTHPDPALPLEPEPLGNDWIDWIGPIGRLAELDVDLEVLARKIPSLRANLLAEARILQPRLNYWIEILERLNVEVPEAA